LTYLVTPPKQNILRRRGVLEYQIGGYQVLDKWLKDRGKRLLSMEDIKHYCRVVTAIAKTIEVQGEIDSLYPDVEKDTLVV